MEFNKEKILSYQKNRDEFLMFDYATKVIPGKSAKGFKELPGNLWFFKLHWPGDPNMPGMLQIEAMIQLCALSIFSLPGNKGDTMYLLKVNDAKFFSKVIPGSNFEMETYVKSYKRGIVICAGIGYQNGQKACSANFSMILSKLVKQLKVPKKCQ